METSNVRDLSDAQILAEQKTIQNGNIFHSPHFLQVQQSAITEPILILGACQALSWHFQESNPAQVPCEFILTNNAGDLPEKTDIEIDSYSFQVVQIPLRSIINDSALWTLKYKDVEGHQEIFEQAISRLQHFLDGSMKYKKQRQQFLTFVANFFVPQQNPMGRLLPKYDIRNTAYFIAKLNERLEALVFGYQNSYVLDVDQLACMYGKKYIQEDHVNWISHGGLIGRLPEDASRIEFAFGLDRYYEILSDDFKLSIWWELDAMYRTIRQIDQVKLIVVDLDDTLWKGVIGESENISNGIIEGWPLGFIEALGYLKKRGVLLAIISKNNEDFIKEIWPKVFLNRLKLEDFAIIRINYELKVTNMAEIMEVVNILPSSVVFVDDNPVERAAMHAAYPAIRILPRYHYYWRRILLWSAETQVPYITGESDVKTEMMHAQVNREELRHSLSREEFLSSLNVQVKLFQVDDALDSRFARVIELLNKTNQFNTTGIRRTREDFLQGFTEEQKVFAFEVEDNFTAYGLVGVLVVRNQVIEQFVMSCRVVGMDIEIAVIDRLIKDMRPNGTGVVCARFIDTKANLLCRQLWSRCGFTYENDLFQLAENTFPPQPGHICFV